MKHSPIRDMGHVETNVTTLKLLFGKQGWKDLGYCSE